MLAGANNASFGPREQCIDGRIRPPGLAYWVFAAIFRADE
jgi:hypothetical protein